MWFVGTERTNAAARLGGVAARLRRLEEEADRHDTALDRHRRAHGELDVRVRRLEVELEELRRERLEAFTGLWNARQDRDRCRHVARRLRRRAERLRRRTGPLDPGPG
ncbi:hypothetical protein [Nocardiopsis trehalosi]|uniref:hypothetical protein n=1 Tax=Nocardiopsis trehalosi TaxID=109329 RepID=UPI0008361C93|nr:hypothetical protein [Nocardiopsis trehalosi]